MSEVDPEVWRVFLDNVAVLRWKVGQAARDEDVEDFATSQVPIEDLVDALAGEMVGKRFASPGRLPWSGVGNTIRTSAAYSMSSGMPEEETAVRTASCLLKGPVSTGEREAVGPFFVESDPGERLYYLLSCAQSYGGDVACKIGPVRSSDQLARELPSCQQLSSPSRQEMRRAQRLEWYRVPL